MIPIRVGGIKSPIIFNGGVGAGVDALNVSVNRIIQSSASNLVSKLDFVHFGGLPFFIVTFFFFEINQEFNCNSDTLSANLEQKISNSASGQMPHTIDCGTYRARICSETCLV